MNVTSDRFLNLKFGRTYGDLVSHFHAAGRVFLPEPDTGV